MDRFDPRQVASEGLGTKRCSRAKKEAQAHTMVYVTSWDEFVVRAEDMFRRNPMETRYVSKYRHCDAKLVLKVTNDLEVSGPTQRDEHETNDILCKLSHAPGIDALGHAT